MKPTAIVQIVLNLFEALVPITGFIVWRSIKDIRVKAFILYSLFIIVVELTGRYLKTHQLKEANSLFYNYLVIPVEFLFLIAFFFSYLPGKKMKYLAIVFGLTGIASQVIDVVLLKDNKFIFSSFSYIICTLVLLVTLFIFLWRFIQDTAHLQYDKHFVFWVAIASLIYYLGSFPLYAFYNYLYSTDKNTFYTYWYISMAFNMLMYILFSTALLWTTMRYKSSFN